MPDFYIDFDSDADITDYWMDFLGGISGTIYTAKFRHKEITLEDGTKAVEPKLVAVVLTLPNLQKDVPIMGANLLEIVASQHVTALQDQQFQTLLDKQLGV